MATRQNTKLESEGAEFLVLGCLLIEGVSCYKAYVNFPGYDLMAVMPETKRIARIQVKSRWATDYDKSFPFRNTDCDFVVHVALNRGNAFRKRGTPAKGISQPVFYIFPRDVACRSRQNDGWNKVRITKIPNWQDYVGRWDLIKQFLHSDCKCEQD